MRWDSNHSVTVSLFLDLRVLLLLGNGVLGHSLFAFIRSPVSQKTKQHAIGEPKKFYFANTTFLC